MLWAQSTTKDYIRLNKNFALFQVICFTSHFKTSHAFSSYLYSTATQHGNLYPTGWPILFCEPTKEPCVSHSQHRKNRERFWKNAGEWTERVEISKEEIPGSMWACMAVYWPTPGFKGRTYKFCVLNKLDFNFCVRSSPLREDEKKRAHVKAFADIIIYYMALRSWTLHPTHIRKERTYRPSWSVPRQCNWRKPKPPTPSSTKFNSHF